MIIKQKHIYRYRYLYIYIYIYIYIRGAPGGGAPKGGGEMVQKMSTFRKKGKGCKGTKSTKNVHFLVRSAKKKILRRLRRRKRNFRRISEKLLKKNAIKRDFF